jgi:hypothetical protein
VVTRASPATYNVGVSQDSSEQQDRSPDEGGTVSIPDEDLPEDLQPTEDNPLAQEADDDVPEDLVAEGFGPAGSGGTSGDASSSGDDDGAETSSSKASSESADDDADDSDSSAD